MKPRKLLTRVRQFVKSATARLAATYLLIIMIMSLGFSIVFYNTSSDQLGRQLPPDSLYSNNAQQHSEYNSTSHETFDSFFRDRIDEGREALLIKLVWQNIFALFAGSILSYYLARRTLKPIEAAMEAQSQFVSDASHELRTPLTALQTTNEVALRNTKMSKVEAAELIRYNVEEAIKLKTLSDALLGLLKNEGHILDLGPVNLNDVVSASVNEIVKLAVDKNIGVEETVPKISVHANAVALTQVLTILLDNAVKYSPKNTTISVTATQKAKFAYLNVTDQGIGIKATDLQHIFRRFYRASKSRTSQQTAGYGLGLAIADKIIQQHNGSITVHSKPGEGTTFTIKLPVS